MTFENGVCFRNPGELSEIAFKSFGVNAKESQSPFGYFGTGLKYSIAILLRHGCEITIFAGEKKYEFSLQKEDFRGKSFEFLFCNGEKLAFTTELGKTWPLWMAYRELLCNCLDENGCLEEAPLQDVLRQNETRIVVRGAEFAEIAREAEGKYTLLNGSPYKTFGKVDIHRNSSQAYFYKGIRVGSFAKSPIFTYNFKRNLTLSEDRTYTDTYYLEYVILSEIVGSSDEDFLREFIKAPEGSAEYNFRFPMLMTAYPPSETFLEVFREEYQRDPKKVNPTILAYVDQNGSFEDCLPKEKVLSLMQRKELQEALYVLSELGYSVTEEIKVSTSLGKGVLGRAFPTKHPRTIYLAEECFVKGMRCIASTVLEEHLHLSWSLQDFSREFQEHILDRYIALACLKIGEVSQVNKASFNLSF